MIFLDSLTQKTLNEVKKRGLSAAFDEDGEPVLITLDGKRSPTLDEYLAMHRFDIHSAWRELAAPTKQGESGPPVSAWADQAMRQGLFD